MLCFSSLSPPCVVVFPLIIHIRTQCSNNTYLQLKSVGLTAEKYAVAACKQRDPPQGSPWDLTCRMMRTEPQTAAADIS